MRSRNGNFSFTFTISSIIFFLLYSSALLADEYLISYRYTVKNTLLYNEELYISKSMQKCKGTIFQKPLILESKNSHDLKYTLQRNSEIFFQYLSKIGLVVENHETLYNQTDQSFTIITLKTTCFKVDFNENFVKIAPLK